MWVRRCVLGFRLGQEKFSLAWREGCAEHCTLCELKLKRIFPLCSLKVGNSSLPAAPGLAQVATATTQTHTPTHTSTWLRSEKTRTPQASAAFYLKQPPSQSSTPPLSQGNHTGPALHQAIPSGFGRRSPPSFSCRVWLHPELMTLGL